MKLINYLIIFCILVLNTALGKEKPPFKNILVLDKPKVYNEIIFQDRNGNQIDLNLINTDELYIATGDADGGDTYSIGIWKSLFQDRLIKKSFLTDQY